MPNYICKRSDIDAFIEGKKCTRVLDIGCGFNSFAKATHLIDYVDNSTHYPGKEFLVVDLNRIERLDFEDGYFDFVYCSHVLEHLENPGKIIREISRIGRAGYIEVPTKLEDNLFSLDGLRDASGRYIGNPPIFRGVQK